MIARMYTLKYTAELLKKSIKTVMRYVQLGMLSARRSGVKSVVIHESELDRFMKPEISETERVRKLVDERMSQSKFKVAI